MPMSLLDISDKGTVATFNLFTNLGEAQYKDCHISIYEKNHAVEICMGEHRLGVVLERPVEIEQLIVFVISGNNINYLIIVIAGTSNNSDLVTFKDMNSDSFFRVSLNNYEQLTQFICLIFINYLVSGESMCKVAKPKGWKRNHVDILAYGNQMVIHKNVLKEAMIRDMIKVVNATIDRESRLIINLD